MILRFVFTRRILPKGPSNSPRLIHRCEPPRFLHGRGFCGHLGGKTVKHLGEGRDVGGEGRVFGVEGGDEAPFFFGEIDEEILCRYMFQG